MSDTRATPAVPHTDRDIPTVGRAVHYVSYGTPGGEYSQCCRAATVTAAGGWVDQETTEDGPGLRTVRQRFDRRAMSLHVMNPTGTFDNTTVPMGDGEDATVPTAMCGGLAYPGGTWHWPVIV